MINPNGQITLNGVTDNELAKIWEFKARNEKAFLFQPNMMQQTQTAQGTPYYNNVHFQFTSEAGLSIVHEVLSFLLKKEEQQKVAGQ